MGDLGQLTEAQQCAARALVAFGPDEWTPEFLRDLLERWGGQWMLAPVDVDAVVEHLAAGGAR